MRGQKNDWFLYTRFINTVENISCCLARVKKKFSEHCEKFDTWNKVVSNVLLPERFSSKLGISPDSEAYPFFSSPVHTSVDKFVPALIAFDSHQRRQKASKNKPIMLKVTKYVESTI